MFTVILDIFVRVIFIRIFLFLNDISSEAKENKQTGH